MFLMWKQNQPSIFFFKNLNLKRSLKVPAKWVWAIAKLTGVSNQELTLGLSSVKVKKSMLSKFHHLHQQATAKRS